MSLKNKLKLLGLEALVAMNLLAFAPNKSKADDFNVNGKIENVLNREPINQGNLSIDGQQIPITSDGTFSFGYDGSGTITHSLAGYNLFTRDISGNFGVGNDSLIIQDFPRGNFEYSLFDIFNYMKFLGLGGHIWGSQGAYGGNWGFFEDPEFLANIWFDPDFNDHYVNSAPQHPDSTYSFMEVIRSVMLEPTRPDSMFGHHILDTGYEWHQEVPDSIVNTNIKGVNIYLGNNSHTYKYGNLIVIEIDQIDTSTTQLSAVTKHEWMAHGVWFADLPSTNIYNPLSICIGGSLSDFSPQDLEVLKVAHNIKNSTDMWWYGPVTAVPPMIKNPQAGKQIRFENSPEPFNSLTSIIYSIEKPGNYNMNLYDISGRRVKELFNSHLMPGTYNTSLDGSNLSSGVYFLNLGNGRDISETKKVTIIK